MWSKPAFSKILIEEGIGRPFWALSPSNIQILKADWLEAFIVCATFEKQKVGRT